MEDTIAALGTAPGKAALAVLRLSGPDTFKITDRVFRAKCGLPAGERRPGRLYFGELLDKTGAVVDLCLAVVSRAPMSYTGEDTAEASSARCHTRLPLALSNARMVAVLAPPVMLTVKIARSLSSFWPIRGLAFRPLS